MENPNYDIKEFMHKREIWQKENEAKWQEFEEKLAVLIEKYKNISHDLSDRECLFYAFELIEIYFPNTKDITIYHIEPSKNGYIFRYNKTAWVNGDISSGLIANREIYIGRDGEFQFDPR